MKKIIEKTAKKNKLTTAQNFLLKVIFDWSNGDEFCDMEAIVFQQFYGLDGDDLFYNLDDLTKLEYLSTREITDGQYWKLTQKAIKLFTSTSLLAAA
jgi:RIO-like serine/threonine protein kinase